MRRLALGLLLSAPAWAAPQRYALPDETAAFTAGPGLDLMQRNCSACHSADYVATQPRPLRDPQSFWRAEVVKMQKAYGAPIEEADIPEIVAYLSGSYGR